MDMVSEIVRAMPALVLAFGLWPFLLGCGLGFKRWLDRYIVGFCSVQALFFLVYIPAIVFGWSSRLLTIVAAVVISLVGIFVACWRYFKAEDRKAYLGFRRPCLSFLKNPFFDTAIVIVAYQVVRYIVKQPYIYGDDVSYITMVTDFVDTNAIYVKSWAGQVEPTPLSLIRYKYVFTSYYPFLGMLSILSGLHPLILCKTVIPALYVPMHYLIVWKIGDHLFVEGNDGAVWKRSKFLFFYVLLIEFGQISYYTLSRRVLIWIWNSKSDCFCLLLPALFFYTYVLLIETSETSKMLGKSSLFYRQFLIMVIALSCNSASLMGLITSAVVMGLWFVIAAIRLRKPSVLLTSLWTLIPHVVTAFLILRFTDKLPII